MPITINLSFKQIQNDNHIFWLQRYDKNHIFGTFYSSFFTFSVFLPCSLTFHVVKTVTNCRKFMLKSAFLSAFRSILCTFAYEIKKQLWKRILKSRRRVRP